jgi:hypothetical protein
VAVGEGEEAERERTVGDRGEGRETREKHPAVLLSLSLLVRLQEHKKHKFEPRV